MSVSVPAIIININNNNINTASVISQLVPFLSLSKAEAALLNYYSVCSSGFRPAEALIAEKTELDPSTVRRAKASLIQKGIIKQLEPDYYSDERRILVNWDQLAAVAFAAELHPEYNDGHVVKVNGKAKRSPRQLSLDNPKDPILWDGKPASYWANEAMLYINRVKKFHDKDNLPF